MIPKSMTVSVAIKWKFCLLSLISSFGVQIDRQLTMIMTDHVAIISLIGLSTTGS